MPPIVFVQLDIMKLQTKLNANSVKFNVQLVQLPQIVVILVPLKEHKKPQNAHAQMDNTKMKIKFVKIVIINVLLALDQPIIVILVLKTEKVIQTVFAQLDGSIKDLQNVLNVNHSVKHVQLKATTVTHVLKIELMVRHLNVLAPMEPSKKNMFVKNVKFNVQLV